MENMTGRVERMVRKSAKRRLWHRAVAIPAAIVVFITTYALILPAIAMERDTYCGLEAHQHGEECYTAELACGFEDGAMVQDVQTWSELTCSADVHQHTEACFDEDGNVICGLADYVVHTHNADCYNAQGELVCTLPEVEAHTHDDSCYVEEIVNVCGQSESEGHVHTADCYTMVSHPELICGQVESEGHVHTADCYTTTEHTYLACGMEESAGHMHDASCYTTVVAEDGTETTELTCALPESLGHVHTDACYVTEAVTELTCTLPESAGHIHTDACWADVQSMELTCGKEETTGHTHTEACFATEKRLVCTKPEVILHTHGDECYTVVGYAEDGSEIKELTCPMTVVQEHVHTADCFTQVEQTVERPHEHTELCYVQVLTCTLPEHEHTDECYVAPAEPEVTEAPAYICGLEEHAHTDVCYDANGELICGLEEHIHDETCLAAEIVEGDTTEIVDGDVEIVEDETPHFQLPVLVCGLSEHEHSTNCMDENMNYVCGLAQHTHTGACYDIPGMDGVTPELTCALHEHFHTEACYNENGELACGLEEHTHTVGCFTLPESAAEPEVIGEPALPAWCGMEEHTHDETCYDENGELICAIEEHTHDDSCFVEPTWYCGFVAHTHDESCMDANGEPICGLIEHTHDASCMVAPTYYCGKAEHTHGENCYDENGALVCAIEEHTHDDSCLIPPVYYCGKAEHIHDENCYDENGNLICGLEEHIHDASCLIQNFVQMAEADGILVTAEYTSEAGIPEEAQLRVTRFTYQENADHFVDRVNEANQVFGEANPDQELQPHALLNIGFYLPNGAEVEPLTPVDVTVQLLDANGLPEGDGYTIVHFASDGTELLDVESEGADQLAFTTDSFSDFIIGNDEGPSNGGSAVADNDGNEGDGEEETVPPINWGATLPNWLVGSYSQISGGSTYSGARAAGNSPTDEMFEHNKTIDYLGDNQDDSGVISGKDNPDTDVDNTKDTEGVTDDLYRLYLDMEGRSEPVDLLIVLDRSGSMFQDSRDKAVGKILFGEDGNGGLVHEFLAPNAGKTDAKEMNHVAMVWYAGYSSIGDGTWVAARTIDPDASSESGVSFSWSKSMEEVNYNFNQDVQGAAKSDGAGGGRSDTATNYVAGFARTREMLNAAVKNSDLKDHRKVVIFISDGVPTEYYKYNDFKSWWSGNARNLTRYGYGADDLSVSDVRWWPDENGVYDYRIVTQMRKGHGQVDQLIYSGVDKTTHYKTMGNDTGKYMIRHKLSWTYGDKVEDDYKVISDKNLVSISDSPYYYETRDCFQLFVDYTNSQLKSGNFKDFTFFTLGIDMNSPIETGNIETRFGEDDRYWILDQMAGKYGRSAIRTETGTDGNLEQALRQVMFPSGVSISDDLSQYVTLYDNAPDVLVTATSKTDPNKKFVLWSGSNTNTSNAYGTIYGTTGPNNQESTIGAGGRNIVDSVTYDGQVIAVHFRSDYCLNKDYTYTLSFNVRLTEQAYNQFAANMNQRNGVAGNSYNAKGEENTDYGGNKTSSGQPGFFSNDKAVVRYTVDNKTYEEDYEYPVVQCWATKFIFTKKLDNADTGVTLADIPFQLQKYNTTKRTWEVYKNGGSIKPGTTDSDSWYLTDAKGQIDFGYLGETGQYRLMEKVPDQYENGGKTIERLTFNVEKGRIVNASAKDGVTLNADSGIVTGSYTGFNSIPNDTYGGDSSATVVNKSNQKQLKIVKQDENGGNLAGASFQLQKKNNSGQYEPFDLATLKDESAWYSPTDADGLVFDGKLPNGEYKLVETDAPDNYKRLTNGVEFKVDSNGVTIVKDPDKAAKVNQEGDVFTLTIQDSILTTSWEIIKQDDSSHYLAGAQFTLYGPFDASVTDDSYKDPDLSWSFTTGNNGKPVDETGKPELTAGKWYYLEETSAPAGYNLMEDIIELQVKEVPGTTSKDRTLTLEAKAKDGSASTGFKSDGTVTVSYDDNSMTGTVTVTVENYTGYELPESGGIGTTVFYVSGLALMALAGAVFCARKRREAQG